MNMRHRIFTVPFTPEEINLLATTDRRGNYEKSKEAQMKDLLDYVPHIDRQKILAQSCIKCGWEFFEKIDQHHQGAHRCIFMGEFRCSKFGTCNAFKKKELAE